MGINKRDEGKKINSNINVTPMVDVMLVLLIIFMVITPMLNNKVNVDLPKADAAVVMEDANKEDAVVVAVTRDGRTFLGGDQVTLDDLGPKISAKLENKLSKEVFMRADQRANYGKVIEYTFSKEKLIYGPAQIEARIDQDTTISQQLSLWNQTGSRVIRGNLLAIPIDDTLLYVEPLYLSAESRQLPELKRLIASTGDRVVMAQTVESLLAALFSQEGKAPAVVTATSTAAPGTRANESPPTGANGEALNHYRRAFDALNKGDWRTFGAEMDAMQKALQGAPAKPPS